MSFPFRTALTLPAGSIDNTIQMAQWAESNGYDDLWFADSGGLDALTLAPIIADRTKSVRIGTAIIPVYNRTAPVLASTTAVISHFAPERFILGLGASSQNIVEKWHGQKLEKPLTRVKETVQVVRSILDGEKTSFQGDTIHSHGYRQAATKSRVPIYMAALRSKMLEAAAEFSDGVILNLFPQHALPKMMEHIHAGAKRAGKKPEDVEVVNRHQVIVTEDRDAARNAIRAGFAPYYATPVYNKFLAWAGYEDVAATIAQGWAEKDREKTTGALDDKLIDEIAIIGSREECQERIREYARGGIHTHIISCAFPDPKVMQATYDAFSKENFSFDG